MSRDLASTTSGPSKTARRQARTLVNKADALLAGILPSASWEAGSRQRAAFLKSEDFERFLGLYLRAMDLDQLEPAYPWNLGSTLNRLGRADLALAFVGRAVKIGEELRDVDWAGPDGYLLWAETAINAGQDEVALVAIAKAVQQAPDDDETGDAAVRLLKALGDSRRARHHGQGREVDAWIPVVRVSGTRAQRGTKSTEDRMAQLVARAFPTAKRRRGTKRTPEPA